MIELGNMSAVELLDKIKKSDYPSQNFLDELEEVVNNVISLECRAEFAKKYYEHWQPLFDKFDKVANSLKHINAHLWMTDCYDNRDEFADFFFNEGYDLYSTFICSDWLSNEKEYNEDVNNILAMVFGEPYDNGCDYAFWRDDYMLNETDLDELIANLIKADKMIDIFLS